MVLKVFIRKICEKTHKDLGKMRERTEGCYGNALQSIQRLCVLFFFLYLFPPCFWKLIELTGGEQSRMLRTHYPFPWLVLASAFIFHSFESLMPWPPSPPVLTRCRQTAVKMRDNSFKGLSVCNKHTNTIMCFNTWEKKKNLRLGALLQRRPFPRIMAKSRQPYL